MSVSSEQAVKVLAQHQVEGEYGDLRCSCMDVPGMPMLEQIAKPTAKRRRLTYTEAFRLWAAEHQVAELAKAGIFPFRVPSSP